VSDWEFPALRTSFKEGVADGLGDGITSNDVIITVVTAGSVVISFAIRQPAGYTGTLVAEKMTNAASLDVLVSSIEAATGRSVEDPPSITSRSRATESGEAQDLGRLSPSQMNGTIAGSVLAVFLIFACSAWVVLYRRRRKTLHAEQHSVQPTLSLERA